MADQWTRELSRRLASGDKAVLPRLLAAKVRDGAVSRELLVLLAYLGDKASLAVLGRCPACGPGGSMKPGHGYDGRYAASCPSCRNSRAWPKVSRLIPWGEGVMDLAEAVGPVTKKVSCNSCTHGVVMPDPWCAAGACNCSEAPCPQETCEACGGQGSVEVSIPAQRWVAANMITTIQQRYFRGYCRTSTTVARDTAAAVNWLKNPSTRNSNECAFAAMDTLSTRWCQASFLIAIHDDISRGDSFMTAVDHDVPCRDSFLTGLRGSELGGSEALELSRAAGLFALRPIRDEALRG